ncbi:HAD-IA family hydrolase [Porifericola rhodea]|uniref:HAD-IA family hydrolase n=1 Tax=Porifericola rhodea TaxID=930972 RepID=UPI0026653528|nr:HAD-IA family hydrolase [Porifericola rhodea]WKN31594.1 HAD-IA family hydrolase [Porifericola rhodea]
MLNSKTTLLFDFDGTIADSLHRLLQISNSFAEEYGFQKIEEKDIPLFRTKSTLEAFRELNVPLLKVPVIAAKVKKAFQQEVHLSRPFPQMKEVLEQLSLVFCLGILTSNSEHNVGQFLKTHKLNHFDFIYTSSNLFGKSRSLRRIMREKAIKMSEIVYIGDEMRDIEAAKNIGMDMIAVSWGAHTEKVLATLKPTYIVHKPSELLTLLQA